MAEDALKRITGTMSSSQPLSRPSPPVPVAANADASGHILDNIIIDYLMNSTDATIDNSFELRTTAPPAPAFSQAETPAVGTNSAMISRMAAHHAVAVELLHKRLGGGAMPPATTFSGVAPPETAALPSDVVESTDMGIH